MTQATDSQDLALLRRMMAGEEEAFTLLYRLRHPAIYRFALRMSGNAALAEDVTQEVFMTLIRDARRFDPTRGTLGGFLFGVARNHLRKRWEEDRRLLPLENESADTIPFPLQGGNATRHDAASGFLSAETSERVRQAISTLPENYREVVILCELEEMSYEEVSAALGCPVGTVRSRLHRGRSLLIEKLREVHPARQVSAMGK